LHDAILLEMSRRAVSKGVSSLAVGADQLFVQALIEKGIPYCVVIPSQDYQSTFDASERSSYERYLQRADEVIELDFSEPSETAYLAAGKFIVDSVELLFAAWDGHAARGLGGTGDVVAYAEEKRTLVLHFNVETLEVKEIR
jgi:uncharacterized phage-like protein YoqJ